VVWNNLSARSFQGIGTGVIFALNRLPQSQQSRVIKVETKKSQHRGAWGESRPTMTHLKQGLSIKTVFRRSGWISQEMLFTGKGLNSTNRGSSCDGAEDRKNDRDLQPIPRMPGQDHLKKKQQSFGQMVSLWGGFI